MYKFIESKMFSVWFIGCCFSFLVYGLRFLIFSFCVLPSGFFSDPIFEWMLLWCVDCGQIGSITSNRKIRRFRALFNCKIFLLGSLCSCRKYDLNCFNPDLQRRIGLSTAPAWANVSPVLHWKGLGWPNRIIWKCDSTSGHVRTKSRIEPFTFALFCTGAIHRIK